MNLVINLDKPEGMTSQEAVTAVKRICRVKKAGHAGTLDPIATGVLLVCLDDATKITRFLMDLDKEYIARIKLGERTDTLDSEGKVIDRVEGLSLSEADVISAIKRFQGEIEQTPPMYSAIKKNGIPLYELARRGITVERQKRPVRIDRIDLLNLDLPFVDIRVCCSKGTYIRSLCSDIGDSLGVGGHVIALRRVATGGFRVEDSITFEDLKAIVDEGFHYLMTSSLSGGSDRLKRSIMTIDLALKDMAEVILKEGEVRKAKKGIPIKCQKNLKLSNSYTKLKGTDGNLLGIGRISRNIIMIERLLNL